MLVIFLKMFDEVDFVLFLRKVAFLVVVEIPLILEPSFGESIVEELEVVFDAVMVEIVGKWDEHHVRNIPAEHTSHYQRHRPLVIFQSEFLRVDQVLVFYRDSIRLRVLLFHRLSKILRRHLENLILEEIQLVFRPVQGQISFRRNLEIRTPEALGTE